MWIPFNTFGEVKGRVRGVSLPYANGQVLIWTDQGLFSLWYHQSAFINKLATFAEANKNFDSATGVLKWQDTAYPMLGECAPANAARSLTLHPSGERVAIAEDTVQILDAAGRVQQTIEDVRVSEPWAVAAFSVDGKVLVVADPTGVRVFRYEVATGKERPRWSALGGTSDQKQLFHAILDNPDEDTPRLMYADWLDEHGDSGRAEFIRLQCRLAERMRQEYVPGNDPDQLRVFELYKLLGARWLAELPLIRKLRWENFWRGFPCIAVGSPTTLVRAKEKVWAAAPVEWVTITDLNLNGARTITTSGLLGRLRALTLTGYYAHRDGGQPLRALLHSPHAANLRQLHLPEGIQTTGMTIVAESPHLTGLEWLFVTPGTLTDEMAEAILASPALTNLRGGSFVSYQLSAAMRKKLKARFRHAVM